MSKARDISNLFSASTDISTDAEVNSAIANHAASTTNRHYKAGNTSSRPESPNVGDIYTNTETGFIEIYESTGWAQVGAIASTPTGVTATDSGSGRDYNDGSASVVFTAGAVAGKTYTITSSPGSYTATGASSPVTVTGLQSATEYTFTATATNNYGTSAASAASAGITATTVPQAPTIGTATGADQSATLTFTAGATGGSSITNYKYSTDNSSYTAFDPAQTSSPLTISGLTNGQSYSFYLKAVNANGDSAASAASNSVVPSLAGSFESIASTVLGSDTSSITISNIPQTYQHLVIRAVTTTTTSSPESSYYTRFNGDTGSNYANNNMIGDGGSQAALFNNNATSLPWGYTYGAWGYSPTAMIVTEHIIPNYSSSTQYKTGIIQYGVNGPSVGGASIQGVVWKSTAAINSFTIFSTGKNMTANTRISVYGIKGE